MSNDAIMSICLAVTICIMVICLCVSSCMHNKYLYGPRNNEISSNDPNLFKTWTYTCTIPETLSAEERVMILKELLKTFNKDNFNLSLTIDGKPVNKEDIDKLINEENDDASV